MPHFIQPACTSCGDCEKLCPTRSIFKTRAQYVIDTDTCEDCAACVPACSVQAIWGSQSGPVAPAPKEPPAK